MGRGEGGEKRQGEEEEEGVRGKGEEIGERGEERGG